MLSWSERLSTARKLAKELIEAHQNYREVTKVFVQVQRKWEETRRNAVLDGTVKGGGSRAAGELDNLYPTLTEAKTQSKIDLADAEGELRIAQVRWELFKIELQGTESIEKEVQRVVDEVEE